MPAEIDAAVIAAGRLEHLHEGVTIGKALAIVAASLLHFREVSISEAKKYPKGRGILISMEKTRLLDELGNQAPTK